MRLVPFVILVIVAALAPSARAESVEERMQRKEEDQYLKSSIDDANEACKSKIKATGDWASFKGKLKDQGNHVSTNCGQAIDGLKSLCHGADDDTRKVIANALTAVTCRGLSDDTVFELKGKTWIITTNVHPKNGSALNAAREFLAKNLK